MCIDPLPLQEVTSEVVEVVEELAEDADITTQEEHTVQARGPTYIPTQAKCSVVVLCVCVCVCVCEYVLVCEQPQYIYV